VTTHRYVYEWQDRILFVYATSHQKARKLLTDAGFIRAKAAGKRSLAEEPFVIFEGRSAPGA